jgi:hypothetical protein
MLSNPEKLEAIVDFRALKYDAAGMKILNLLFILINEVRVDNDTALPDTVIKNQGKIDAWMTLCRYLERDQPNL